MLKSILLAGVLLVTSNFMPSSSVTVPTLFAAHTAAGPAVAAPQTFSVATASVTRPHDIKTITPFETEPSDGLRPEEREFVARINDERTSRGLNALTLDPLLVSVARGHSREMADKDYFDHHSPTPGLRSPMDRFLAGLHDSGESTPSYVLVGENIYYCSESNETYNVAYGHRALMNSPGHRANILEPRFAKIGLGVYRNAQGEFWVTEMFLKDRE